MAAGILERPFPLTYCMVGNAYEFNRIPMFIQPCSTSKMRESIEKLRLIQALGLDETVWSKALPSGVVTIPFS